MFDPAHTPMSGGGGIKSINGDTTQSTHADVLRAPKALRDRSGQMGNGINEKELKCPY